MVACAMSETDVALRSLLFGALVLGGRAVHNNLKLDVVSSPATMFLTSAAEAVAKLRMMAAAAAEALEPAGAMTRGRRKRNEGARATRTAEPPQNDHVLCVRCACAVRVMCACRVCGSLRLSAIHLFVCLLMCAHHKAFMFLSLKSAIGEHQWRTMRNTGGNQGKHCSGRVSNSVAPRQPLPLNSVPYENARLDLKRCDT